MENWGKSESKGAALRNWPGVHDMRDFHMLVTESTLVTVLERIFRTRYGTSLIQLFIQFDLAAESREVSSSAIKMLESDSWGSRIDMCLMLLVVKAARKRSSEFEFEESDPEVPPEGQKLAVSQLW
ncbi:unnamed protein product [Prunus armeniaca]|uniref:Uncharacterized protein n=1 Tax=Prunus armeniaca TaxID=36596 RepID=A0A6J5WAA5_PRUAR|nr:unnamed protein product [Prunus armeniaca]